jgi:methionine biosynthesis protein MetW
MINSKQSYEKYWQEKRSETLTRSGEKSFQSEILESIETVLRNGNRLLDVGCGDGSLIEIARSRFDEVYGCDISELILKDAKERGIISTCLDLNTGHLPYRDKSFNTITCLEVIEHVLNPIHLLKDLNRLLRPKGQLVLSTPNIRYFKNVGRLLLTGRFPHTTTDTFVWGGGHLHYFTRKDLSFLLREAGLKKMKFYINEEQFRRSMKRRFTRGIIGNSIFAEWFCGGIIVEAIKG